MAKAVILKTDEGIKLLGTIQCSNGAWFDAEGCYKYCNMAGSDRLKYLYTSKLSATATLLGKEKYRDDWFTKRENFIDIEIPYECDQTYHL